MNPVDVLVDDLARQVAQKAVEAAEWKTRAVIAEAKLAELQAVEDGAPEVDEEA